MPAERVKRWSVERVCEGEKSGVRERGRRKGRERGLKSGKKERSGHVRPFVGAKGQGTRTKLGGGEGKRGERLRETESGRERRPPKLTTPPIVNFPSIFLFSGSTVESGCGGGQARGIADWVVDCRPSRGLAMDWPARLGQWSGVEMIVQTEMERRSSHPQSYSTDVHPEDWTWLDHLRD
jgi:hypothetical protein